MKCISTWFFAVTVVLLTALPCAARQESSKNEAAKLVDLLAEAERSNPQIQAARQEWHSMQQMPTQVSTLPDPQIALQQMNVGSPRPFAGFTNSDFAFIGLGVSQDFPYPGKLRLKGDLAKKDADIAEQRVEAVRRAILSELQVAYFRAAFLAKQKTIRKPANSK